MTKPTEAPNQPPPRLRLGSDVDLTKAKNGCKRCHGTGRRGYKTIEDPENDGKEIKVPLICRCVTRGGGVKEDQLDLMGRDMVKQLEDGSFAKTLASDIMGLPMEHRMRAFEQLEADSKNKEKLPAARLASTAALKFLRDAIKEDSHGDA